MAVGMLLGCTVLCSAVTYSPYSPAAFGSSISRYSTEDFRCRPETNTTHGDQWGYQPLYQEASVPVSRFESTSLHKEIANASLYTTVAGYNPDDVSGPRFGPFKSSNPWDSEPDDDPIGVVPVVPVGDPLILLVLAMMYLIWKKARLSWRKQPNK